MSETKTFAQAINEGLHDAMAHDENVICYGLGATDPKRIFISYWSILGNNRKPLRQAMFLFQNHVVPKYILNGIREGLDFKIK